MLKRSNVNLKADRDEQLSISVTIRAWVQRREAWRRQRIVPLIMMYDDQTMQVNAACHSVLIESPKTDIRGAWVNSKATRDLIAVFSIPLLGHSSSRFEGSSASLLPITTIMRGRGRVGKAESCAGSSRGLLVWMHCSRRR